MAFLIFLLVAVVAVGAYARNTQRSGEPRTVRWFVATALASALGLTLLVVAIFVVGTLIFGG